MYHRLKTDEIQPQMLGMISPRQNFAAEEYLWQDAAGEESSAANFCGAEIIPGKILPWRNHPRQNFAAEKSSPAKFCRGGFLRGKILPRRPPQHHFAAESIINQISGLSSDPVLNHLVSIRQLKRSNMSNQTNQPTTDQPTTNQATAMKPPGSPRKCRPQPAIGRGFPLNTHLKIKVMAGLGRLYADLKVSISCLEQHVTLGKILFHLFSSLGWIDWAESLKSFKVE
ncbi:hypothetical protein VP01_3014g1 [Puccinia sorghi]|uniref:Uncharacterized protein n=1 Tax=Puccinia sorghi TaxID=27349 RepID=A0A0L6V088_9BASI|nr:hypothetical protein VP01_3014g1 [Puccinia sorghi]